ncbi:MAG: hypothetical protein JKY09_08405 [Crocinitomicaceae bacterium]|nr:hypothetical protein [Crocinitomicaceae bacterium]
MLEGLGQYKNSNHFFYEKGSSLTELLKTVPDLPGVYYVIRLARGKVQLVYISALTDDEPTVKLKTRLLNQQSFFDKKIMEEGIDALDIYWFVTVDEENQDLPAFVETKLSEGYVENMGEPALWNQ